MLAPALPSRLSEGCLDDDLKAGDEEHATANKRIDPKSDDKGGNRDVEPEQFRTAVARIIDARRVLVLGIGPSSALAEYFVIQLARFGLDAASLRKTGLSFADDLQRLRDGDLVVILAYGRVYRELAALLSAARRCGARTILLTDTLAGNHASQGRSGPSRGSSARRLA